MPSPSNSSGGTVFGLIAGLVVLAGIIAAPLYTRHMQTDQAALNGAVANDLDVIRRAVATIDANLGELSAIRSSDAGKIDPAALEGLSKKPQELNAQFLPSLKSLNDILERVRRSDETRGTKVVTDGASKSGAPEARAALAAAQKDNANYRELLQQAKRASTNLDGMTQGALSARQHVGVLQAQSSLHFVEGRLNLLRAVWERQQAADLLNAATVGSEAVVDMRRTAEACGGAVPTGPLEAVEKKIKETDVNIGKWKIASDSLSQAVAQRQSALDELKRVAAESREKLAQMDAKGFQVKPSRQAVDEFRKYETEYRKLSEEAAKAEKEAAEIENGTVDGGTVSANAEEDILNATITGGTLKPGLRDLKARLETLQQLLAGAKKMKEALVALQSDMKKRSEELAEAKSSGNAEAGKAADLIDAMLGDARKHTQLALKAADDAAKSFSTAADLAGRAQAQAKQRSTNARTKAGELTAPDERLDRIKNDFPTETAAWFNKGEADHYQAMAMEEKILAASSQYDAEETISKAAGTKSPESVEETISSARTKGLERIAIAIGSFDQWITQTKSINHKTGDGINIAGKDLLWEGQVAKAASLLLKLRLESDAAVARGSITQAYDLLREAVQGKEQSPRLQQALATLVHIQNTAN